MVSRELFFRKILSRLLFAAVLMTVPYGLLSNFAAADTDKNESYNIVSESFRAMWLGEDYSPELKQKQQVLKEVLKTGALDKAGLEAMLGQAILSILDQHKTSRYNLRQLPERVEALFSPVMTWPEVKKVLWGTAASPVQKGSPILLKVGTLAPPGTPWLSVPETITIPEIENLTDGNITIKIYGGGVMGEDVDILKKMDAGQLDSCGCTALGVLEASPAASVLLLPGLFNSYEEVDYICEKFRKRLDKAFEEKGYALWALIDTGTFYIFSRNKISGLGDIRRQKVITWFGVIETTLFQELKINATPVAVPEIVRDLNTGQAEINVAPAAWMLGMQAYQYSNYYLKQPLLYSPAAIIGSARTKDRLQKQLGVSAVFAFNLEEMLVSEFNALEPEWNRQIRKYEEKSLMAFETKCGMKAVTFSPEDQQLIEKANKAVRAKLAGKVFSEELMNDILKSLEEYRARR